MPPNPSFYDYFALRVAPGTHLLQSAALATARGEPEEVILACLLHDMGSTLMKTDHGYWGAALIEPYVSERVTFAVRYHQALRFFPDAETGYEYPIRYLEAFGIDYVPPPYIQDAYKYARAHKWYGLARSVRPTISTPSTGTSIRASTISARSSTVTSAIRPKGSATTTRRWHSCGARWPTPTRRCSAPVRGCARGPLRPQVGNQRLREAQPSRAALVPAI